ncbi:MAG TPA: HEAT repeat domain-containing protein [Thermoflexia bacterium]|nr:HEAT repeat domain-containing protein [Thermoflexia bacterium]
MERWHFDPLSAAIGALAAFLLLGLTRILRPLVARLRQGSQRVVSQVTASAEQRYRQRVVAWASEAHLLSSVAPLGEIFVSPRLIPPLPHPDPVSPLPVDRRPISLEEALSGHPRLAILGAPGSGRTTLLTFLALTHAQSADDDRLPLYIDLLDLEWGEEGEENGAPDAQASPSVDRLIHAAVEGIGGRSGYAAPLRKRIADGTALILVDGWDALPEPARRQAAAWIGQLADDLPGNLWIVAAGNRGFGPLADAGFIPLRLAPWTPDQATDLLRRLEGLLYTDQEMPSYDPAPLQHALKRGANAMELTFLAWLLSHGETIPSSRGESLLKAIEWFLSQKVTPEEEAWLPATLRVALGSLALTLQQEGRFEATRAEVEAALEAALPPEGERPSKAREHAWEAITKTRAVLLPRGAEAYAFAHPLWQAVLAARQALTLSPEVLTKHLDDPTWEAVVDFYAAWGPMEPVIRAWLSQPDDLWYTRLRRAAAWVAQAPTDARWRNGVMGLLARTFLQPNVPLPIRQRLADALVHTGDPGVAYFLKQATRHARPDVRIAAVRALGHIAKEADLSTFETVLADKDPRVREAAAEALGIMGGRPAVHHLTLLLAQADQDLRVAAARALARCGEEGLEVLKEALRDEDFLTRRAAVYGLAEVEEPWVWERIASIAVDDPEWIVRSAAETVLEAREKRTHPIQPPLKVSEMGWLIAWAAQRGEAVGRGEAAFTVLLTALREGDPEVRRAAAQALGLVGKPEHASALREAMEDEDPEVAAVALEALEELCLRHDIMVR